VRSYYRNANRGVYVLFARQMRESMLRFAATPQVSYPATQYADDAAAMRPPPPPSASRWLHNVAPGATRDHLLPPTKASSNDYITPQPTLSFHSTSR
jgi:hypothetical protein